MRAIALRLALALLLLSMGAAHAAPDETKGTLVIIGGALRADNAPVWQRIVQLAGGPGARIAVFASASGNPAAAGAALAQRLRSYGADPFVVPVAVGLADTDYRVAADDPALAAQVRAAAGAFFSGGDQGRITRALRRPDGANTRVLDALWEMYRRGGVIAGTSAGAAIMSSTMFYDAKAVLPTLKLGVDDGREIAAGLGFIGTDVFIDQHLLVRGRFARMLPVMLKKGYKTGLGIDENTALVVSPQREVEVVGYKGALLLDLAAASSEPGAFNISNARISYLDSGDRYLLRTGEFVPGPDKAQGRVDPARPYYRGEIFSSDILGNTAVVDLMWKLADSDQVQAIGLAIGGPAEVEAGRGFEFRLSRAPDTAAWGSATSEAYSIHRLRLDVAPVELAQPLYRRR